MPLRDHFHPPLSVRRHWHSFHNAWATYISSDLNRRLPRGYFAEPNVQFGIEIDVATFEEDRADARNLEGNSFSGWSPPAPVRTIPFPRVTDRVEVLIYQSEAGPTLAGALELVSPANKDRPEHREAFASKCDAYLQQGVGLVVVDVVSGRTANLHDDLLARFAANESAPLGTPLYAAAYRPVDSDGGPRLEIWQSTLALGDPLPTVPLWLRGAFCLPVDLEATYEQTCREQRIPDAGE